MRSVSMFLSPALNKRMQIDLQEPMKIDSIVFNKKKNQSI